MKNFDFFLLSLATRRWTAALNHTFFFFIIHNWSCCMLLYVVFMQVWNCMYGNSEWCVVRMLRYIYGPFFFKYTLLNVFYRRFCFELLYGWFNSFSFVLKFYWERKLWFVAQLLSLEDYNNAILAFHCESYIILQSDVAGISNW